MPKLSREVLEDQISECTKTLVYMRPSHYGTLEDYKSETLHWQDRRSAFRRQLKELTQ